MFKKRAKDLIVVLIIATVLAVAITTLDIKTVDEYYNEPLDKITAETKVTYLSVDCKTVLDNMEKLSDEAKKIIPQDGVILEKQAYAIKKGDTALSILLRALRHYKIPISVKGDSYVEGINNLFEFDCGNRSGWLVKVNGKLINVAASKYFLNEGDVIEWRYTCEIGDVR